MESYSAKIGKREVIYLGGGETIEKVIRIGIQEAIIVYKRDYKSDIGNLNIYLENGDWIIGYEVRKLSYYPAEVVEGHIDICLDITDESQKVIKWEKDEKTGEYYVKEKADWLIKDWGGCGFKVITHSINETEIAEELIGPKIKRSITKPNVTLEYYKNSKILKLPFHDDEIRLNINNGYLGLIRNDRKIIEIFPLKKELHYYEDGLMDGIDFKVIHQRMEVKHAEELIEKEIIKPIPESKLEYYKNNKILKFLLDSEKEIRINLENKNIEYINKYKKEIEIIPLNKELYYYGDDFKVIIHPRNIEQPKAKALLKPEIIKSIPGIDLEYYKENDILKIPILKDEIRINIENKSLEYIRNNKKIIKAFPLNKELHFYGIEPRVRKYIVTSQGARLANQNTN
jgi:hypothetical protein